MKLFTFLKSKSLPLSVALIIFASFPMMFSASKSCFIADDGKVLVCPESKSTFSLES